MQRKKVSTGTNNAAAVIDLDDDEQLVEEVTTTKRIGRQRRAKPATEEVIDAEIIEDDDDDAEDVPEFGDNTLAAAIFGEEDKNLENQYCTVAIRRTPDSMNDHFLNGCGSVMNLPPMRNVELTADKSEIEDRVRDEYGGGHYYFQIRYNDRLATAWKSTLGDSAAAKAAAKAAAAASALPQQAAAPAAAAPPVDPMDSFLDNLEKQQRMRTLLFGDAERQFRDEITQLRAELAAKSNEPPAPQSETLVILEKALASNSPDVTERLLDYAFPSGDKEPRHWLADAISVVMENKEAIGGMLGGLLGIPQPAAGPSNIADLMKMQPPPNALGPGDQAKPREIFKRTAAEPKAETAEYVASDFPLGADPLSTAETPMPDRDAIDAETGIGPDLKAVKGKARGKAK